MKLLVTVDRDEDGVFVVECPSIPGCVSQGRTEEEALSNIQDAIRGCLAVRAEQGMPPTVKPTRLKWSLDECPPPGPKRQGGSSNLRIKSLGWHVARQTGSHIILIKGGHPATLSV